MRIALGLLITAAFACAQDPERQLAEVARAATIMVDGDVARRIVTPRALEWMFKKDPRDPWVDSDNYDVDHASFIQTKKTLMRLARLADLPCNVNLWMPLPGNNIHVVIRNELEISQFWSWGSMHQPVPPPMKEVLETGRQITVRQKPGYISVLAPVRDSLGDVAGLVEVVTQTKPDAHENVK